MITIFNYSHPVGIKGKPEAKYVSADFSTAPHYTVSGRCLSTFYTYRAKSRRLPTEGINHNIDQYEDEGSAPQMTGNSEESQGSPC
jgi:hypothetical protein